MVVVMSGHATVVCSLGLKLRQMLLITLGLQVPFVWQQSLSLLVCKVVQSQGPTLLLVLEENLTRLFLKPLLQTCND